MILRRLWDYPALARFYQLPRHEAEALDRATIAYAERGEGKLHRQGAHWLLPAGAHVAVLAIDEEGGTVTVVHFFRMPRR